MADKKDTSVKDNGYIGARGSIVLDFVRPVKTSNAEGKEVEANLMYQLILPIGASWDVVFDVLNEMTTEVKNMQERALKQSEELKKKETQSRETSPQEDSKDKDQAVDVEIEIEEA